MCCYLRISDEMLKAIIEAMHQTSDDEVREDVVDQILDSELLISEKTLAVNVKSVEIKEKIETGEYSQEFLTAAQIANPNIKQIKCMVKEPLDMSKIAIRQKHLSA